MKVLLCSFTKFLLIEEVRFCMLSIECIGRNASTLSKILFIEIDFGRKSLNLNSGFNQTNL